MNFWDRFNAERAKIRKSRPVEFRVDDNGCWICTSHGLGAYGYPYAAYGGRNRSLCSIVRVIRNGKRDEGPVSRHTCDVAACIRPTHIIGGTQAQNVHDMLVRRGPGKRAKLTPAKVRFICRSTKPNNVLAKALGVATSVVLGVRKRKTWRHVLNADGTPLVSTPQAPKVSKRRPVGRGRGCPIALRCPQCGRQNIDGRTPITATDVTRIHEARSRVPEKQNETVVSCKCGWMWFSNHPSVQVK